MLVSIMEELMKENLQFSSWLKPRVNLNLPWAYPPPVSLVPTKFPTFDFREAGHD